MTIPLNVRPPLLNSTSTTFPTICRVLQIFKPSLQCQDFVSSGSVPRPHAKPGNKSERATALLYLDQHPDEVPRHEDKDEDRSRVCNHTRDDQESFSHPTQRYRR